MRRSTLVFPVALLLVGPASLGAQSRADTLTQSGVTEGLRTPESVRYDASLDVFFVSEINGTPTQKDNNGAIQILTPKGERHATLAAGGAKGVTLDAPKGMAIVGDTLWVADIDVVRGFNKRTGAPIANIDLAQQHAVFLNDIAVGVDGALYITDTGIQGDGKGGLTHTGPDRVFRITGRRVSVALAGAPLVAPNGIAWDAKQRHFIIVPFGGDTILAWKPGSKPTALATGQGQYDGVEVLDDGRVLVTDWATQSVGVLDHGKVRILARGFAGPADIGIDTHRHRLALPQLTENKVVYFDLGSVR